MKNNPIDINAFNAHINHLISNKRRYMPKFKNNAQKKSQIETSTGRKNSENCPTEQETSTPSSTLIETFQRTGTSNHFFIDIDMYIVTVQILICNVNRCKTTGAGRY